MEGKDLKSVIEIISKRIETEEAILQLSSSSQCLEYHTGYLNALKEVLKGLTNEKD